MKIAIEEISAVKKAITVEIPEEVVAQEFKAAYADLNRRVHIPGFRPGKVPFSILEKRYARDVEEDVIRRLIPDYYRRAIQEAHLSPVEPPTIENVELKKNAPMLFRATVEIKPDIELQDYKGLKIKRQTIAVQESDVEKTLEGLREKQAVLEAYPPDHAIEMNDHALIDFTGSIDGKPFEGGTGQGVLVQVGAKALVSGFEEKLIGHKMGEKVEILITFPSDYYKPDLAGKTASFGVEIREVKRKALPALDDEFAKDVGEYASLEELKQKIREGLEAQSKKEEERSYRKALMKQLVELHAFEVPPSLVEKETQELLGQIQSRLPSGMTLEEGRLDPQALRSELEPVACENVKGQWILEAIADREEISISKEELEEALRRIALGLKLAPEDLKRLILSREGSLEGLRRQLREDKALDRVYRAAAFL